MDRPGWHVAWMFVVALPACGPSEPPEAVVGEGSGSSSGGTQTSDSSSSSSSSSGGEPTCDPTLYGATAVSFGVCLDVGCGSFEQMPWRGFESQTWERQVRMTCEVGVAYADDFGGLVTRLEDCEGDEQPLVVAVRVPDSAAAELAVELGKRVQLSHLTSRDDLGIAVEDAWTLRDADARLLAFFASGAALPPEDFTAPLRLSADDALCFSESASYCGGEIYSGKVRVGLDDAVVVVGPELASLDDPGGGTWRLGAAAAYHSNYLCGVSEWWDYRVSGLALPP